MVSRETKNFRIVCENIRKIANIAKRIRRLAHEPDEHDDTFYSLLTPTERRKIDKYLTSCGFEFQGLIHHPNENWRRLALMACVVLFGVYRVDWSSFVVETEPWDDIKETGRLALMTDRYNSRFVIPATSPEFFDLIDSASRSKLFRQKLTLFKLSLV